MTSLVSPDINFSSINQILTVMNGKNPFHDRVDLSTNPEYSKVIDVALNYLSQCNHDELNKINCKALFYGIEKRRMAILLLTSDEVAEVTNASGKKYKQLKKETVDLAKKIKDLFEKKGIKIHPSSEMLANEDREISEHRSYIRGKASHYHAYKKVLEKIEQMERLVFLDTFNIFLPLYLSSESLFISILKTRYAYAIQRSPKDSKKDIESCLGKFYKDQLSTTNIALQTATIYLTNVKREDLDRTICDGIVALTDYLEKEMENYLKADEMWRIDPKNLDSKTLIAYEQMKPHFENFEKLYNEIMEKMEALGVKVKKKA